MNILAKIKEPWTFSRLFRVGFGLFGIFTGVFDHQNLFIFLGSLLFLQGLLNMGCGAKGCAPTNESPHSEYHIKTEKLKIKK